MVGVWLVVNALLGLWAALSMSHLEVATAQRAGLQ